MKQIGFLLILLTFLLNCSDRNAKAQDRNERSKVLNNRAMHIYTHNLFDKDSLNIALTLIDSAVALDENYSYLTNKYVIARRSGNLKSAQNACDRALLLRKNDFGSYIHKGYLYEDAGQIDSAKFFYLSAYTSVDTSKQFNKSPLMKERQKIILAGLIGDSLLYKQLLSKFVQDFSADSNYKYIFEELKSFGRARYLSNL